MKGDFRGQTLIETLMGLFIVTIGVVSSVTLFVATTKASGDTEDTMIATNLAREAVEAVRGIRDDNWLTLDANPNSIFWDKDIDSPGNDREAILTFDPSLLRWTLDFKPDSFVDLCGAGAFRCADIFFDNTTGLYRQFSNNPTQGTKTKFQRMITVNPICLRNGRFDQSNGNDCPNGQGVALIQRRVGLQIIVTVQWIDGEGTKNITMEEQLYQWKEVRND